MQQLNVVNFIKGMWAKWLLLLMVLMGSATLHAQIIINEVYVNPATGTTDTAQSLVKCASPTIGEEWIEIFNSSKCDTIDLECYTLGCNTSSTNNGSFSFPSGTIIAPLHFLVIGGSNATNVNIKLNTYCGGRQICSSPVWSLENGNGWIALYKPDGKVADAVFWTANASQPNLLNSDPAYSGTPCFPPTACGAVTLKSASTMSPGVEIGYAGKAPNAGTSIARNVDGGSWQTNLSPTPGNCNGPCLQGSDLGLALDSLHNETCRLANGVIVVSGTGGVAPYNYVWSTGEKSPELDSLVAGVYSVTVTDDANCKFSSTDTITDKGDSVHVTAVPKFVTIFNGDETQLTSSTTSAIRNAEWSPIAGLSCVICTDPIAKPRLTTTYVISITDINGCIGTDTVQVEVVKDENSIFIPTGFTPEAATNNILYVRSPKVTTLDWRIFDRWGKEVFATHDQATGWNGTDKSGGKLNAGVYVYYLTATFLDGKDRTIQGNVTLLR